MKYCPNCGYPYLRDDAQYCPACGEDIKDQIPYDYPEEEYGSNSNYYDDAPLEDKQRKKERKDKSAMTKVSFVIAGALLIVVACICVLCLM